MNAQEKFWRGDFGDAYMKRNVVDWQARIPFWRMIASTTQARSVLDVGCNAGWNLMALRKVDHTIVTRGIDINEDAVYEARSRNLDVDECSLFDVGRSFRARFDLVCTSGVLIHVGPKELRDAMLSIVIAARRFVVAVEYEADEEVQVDYRGNADRLWKRPFGKLYEELGLRMVAEGAAEGFNDCRYWLLTKEGK